jgi:hypothetical protein
MLRMITRVRLCLEFRAAKLTSVMLTITLAFLDFLELIFELEKQFFYFFLVNQSVYQTTRCHSPEHSNIDTQFHDLAIYKIRFLSVINVLIYK